MAVAIAHLDELLRAIEASNSRAMFLVGLNVASNSLFVAVLASLNQPWEAAVLPVGIALVNVILGLWVLRSRRTPQFPTPTALLRAQGMGLADDQLAWSAVEAIEEASGPVNQQVNRITRWVTILELLTAAHMVTLITTGLALVVR